MLPNLDQLNAQERDLLRLLAQGHTAKTIANLTGLSVNRVNERLRSARRKTGAVSSRELARHLLGQAHDTPQKTWNKLFGVGEQRPARHRSKTGRTRGPGVSNLGKATMALGLIFAAGLAGVATSTPELPMPLTQDPTSATSAMEQPGPAWEAFTAPNAPGVAFLAPNPSNPLTSVPQVMLTCQDISMTAIVRGFRPRDSWPQPAMELRIGDITRTGLPRVTASPDVPALEYAFAIADEVLEPLADGEPVRFTFDGQTVQAPAIPEPERSRFVRQCGDLVHPGMRRRGAASARVY